jgi:hypothetical protein
MVYIKDPLGPGDSSDRFEGETAADVVTAMATAIFPDRDAGAYMLETAERARLWNGAVIDPFTPETFLESMEKFKFIRRES